MTNQILSLKQKGPDADTLVLEKKIDQMVYALYGLTKKEIRIIKEATE